MTTTSEITPISPTEDGTFHASVDVDLDFCTECESDAHWTETIRVVHEVDGLDREVVATINLFRGTINDGHQQLLNAADAHDSDANVIAEAIKPLFLNAHGAAELVFVFDAQVEEAWRGLGLSRWAIGRYISRLPEEVLAPLVALYAAVPGSQGAEAPGLIAHWETCGFTRVDPTSLVMVYDLDEQRALFA